MILAKIQTLPEELSEIIYKFIPSSTKALLTNKLFLKYYKIKICEFDFNNYTKYDTYIRDIVRNGREIPFNIIINKAFLKWEKPKSWRWKNLVFPNYLSYVKHLTIRYNQTKLTYIVNKTMKHLGIKKYKKIRSKNILWNS